MRYLLCLMLAGCTSMPAETAWQALHLVDTAQTLQIARAPDRYWEAWSAWAIGKHPSERSVIAYMAGTALVHYLAADWLHERHPRLFIAFETLTLADTGRCVVMNYRIGL